MKKILIFGLLVAVAVSSCKKKENNPSITVSVSYPEITFTNGIYYSVPVGGTLPTNIATAYDTVYKQSLSVILIDSAVQNQVPGIYTAQAYAKNKYGYVTTVNYYIAVTNIASSENLAGNWYQIPGAAGDSTATTVTQLANGFYNSSNLLGVNMITNSADVFSGNFVQINDSTILFDPALVSEGLISNDTGVINTTTHLAGDTTMTYVSALGTVTFNH